jgi:hypothetical protein
VRTLDLYDISFIGLHKNKSTGVMSGDLGGQGIRPPRPIQGPSTIVTMIQVRLNLTTKMLRCPISALSPESRPPLKAAIHSSRNLNYHEFFARSENGCIRGKEDLLLSIFT